MRITVIIGLLASALLASAVSAQPLQCGIKPLPPLGCKSENAHCVCDAAGHCHWEFDCGR
jgi:hypothetical protein